MGKENNFTPRVEKAIKTAKEYTVHFNKQHIIPEALFVAILAIGRGTTIEILKKQISSNKDEKLQDLIQKLHKEIGKGIDKVENKDITLSDSSQDCIKDSAIQAKKLGQSYISVDHIVLSIILLKNSQVCKILSELGFDIPSLVKELNKELNTNLFNNQLEKIPSNNSEDEEEDEENEEKKSKNKGKTKLTFLNKFSINLNDKAERGELDPIIGREQEIDRVIHVLSRKRKNNPVLVGNAGVGKTAIVEGLAERIIEGEVPNALKDKVIYLLDLTSMVAGTKYRGDFEKRLKGVMDEVKSDKNIIIFIDEIHTLIGAGGGEGTMDASNIIKPALARGDFTCIGATTSNEHRKYFEKDQALERRFQAISVAEPSIEDSIEILNGLRESYEKFHGVKYEEGCFDVSCMLSAKYINDRYLPDKAIDLIDEAGAKTKLKQNPDVAKKINKLKDELEQVKRRKNELVRNQRYEEAVTQRDEQNKLEFSIKQLRNEAAAKNTIVTKKDIQEVISSWTNIPTNELSVENLNKIYSLEDSLNANVIGQQEAIAKVVKKIKRYKTPFRNTSRPIGSFIFAGPSGVGKTELSKVIAKEVFDSESNLIRFDMSEYQDQTSVNKLLGASAGYVGYEDGSLLAKQVKEKPHSVVLFDEIEKASPDVSKIFLQILDEGIMKDNVGKIVDFRNCIIIVTCNIGVADAAKSLGFGNQDSNTIAKENIQTEIKKFFKIELLNRFDELIVFNTLSEKEANLIVDLELRKLNKRILEVGKLYHEREFNLQLNWTNNVINYISEHGFSKEYGAREIKRVIESEIENLLVNDFLSEKIPYSSVINLDVQDNTINYKIQDIKNAKTQEKRRKKEKVVEKS